MSIQLIQQIQHLQNNQEAFLIRQEVIMKNYRNIIMREYKLIKSYRRVTNFTNNNLILVLLLDIHYRIKMYNTIMIKQKNLLDPNEIILCSHNLRKEQVKLIVHKVYAKTRHP